MMLGRVLRLISGCSGTGTVTLLRPVRFCIALWLPLCRTSRKPWDSSMRRTSEPERVRSLPDRNLDLCHEYIRMQTSFDFGGLCSLEKEGEGLDKVGARRLYRVPLAGDIQLGAQGYARVVFAFDNRRQAESSAHVSYSIRQSRRAERSCLWPSKILRVLCSEQHMAFFRPRTSDPGLRTPQKVTTGSEE